MTSWWKRGRFTTTPVFFLFLWCPPNCIYGVHIQFNIPNLLFFFLKIGVRGPRWHQRGSAPTHYDKRNKKSKKYSCIMFKTCSLN
ncbi:hypothetical protein HanRHA438_Chr09g0384501 [Helianthus annuus]|nr:hypothetical protein HanIR_Chr09g0401971 [Helianthus annuus]KAJ0886888.1 hypothetical protein HanRHA438_Chr09g0384501 [Helianthus annuus]